MSKLKIGIIGLGMVGEPIRRWFQECNGHKRGKDLFCYDVDPKKGYFDDFNKADIVFVAVPTPSNPDGSCKVSIVESAVKSIKDGKIVVIKSTVTPGTVESLQKKYPKKSFIFNPEFLTESQAWIDFTRPDRQIVAFTSKSKSDSKEILNLLPQAPFVRPWQSDYSKKQINVTEAEIAKYAANIFGYMKVIYGNILADVVHGLNHVFQKKGIRAVTDYENIREVISADSRIGPAWLNVEHGDYSGAGGYCFPKDMSAFLSFIKELIRELESQIRRAKNKIDVGLIKSLKAGAEVLEVIHEYNKNLLKWQGLTLEDVGRHDKELVVQKRKKIRI